MSAAVAAQSTLLVLGVGFSWIAAFGLLSLPDPYARLHCVGLLGASSGFFFTTAILVDRGVTPLGLKSLAAFVLALLTGAVAIHATGRALRLRRHRDEGGR